MQSVRSRKTSTDYARLNCRVSASIKNRAEEAASLLGQSITDFTEFALAEKAQAVLDKHERITLSDRDFARFVDVINNSPAPTPRLIAAMGDYHQLKTANPETNL